MRRWIVRAVALAILAIAAMAAWENWPRPDLPYPQPADLIACNNSDDRAVCFLQIAQGADALDARWNYALRQSPRLQRAVLNGPWPLWCRAYRDCSDEDFRGQVRLWETEAVVAALEADRRGEPPERALALADSLAERVERLRRRSGQRPYCANPPRECPTHGEVSASMAYRRIWNAERNPERVLPHDYSSQFDPTDALLAATSLRAKRLVAPWLIHHLGKIPQDPETTIYIQCYPGDGPSPDPIARAQRCIEIVELALDEYPLLPEMLTGLYFELAGVAAASDQWELANEALARGMARLSEPGFELASSGWEGTERSSLFFGLITYALADLRRQGRIP